MRRFLSLPLVLTFTLFLAACDTAEERAEEHYQNALTLLEAGDVDRAIVELRNVFRLVPTHFEARHELARVQLEEKNNIQSAYRQYLRIAEQYPEDLLARVRLSEMAFFNSNWDEMRRHGTVAVELAPEDPSVSAIATALEYQTGVLEDDERTRRVAAETAAAQIDPAEPNRILREIILDDKLRQQEFTDALTMLDALTEEFPETQRYWRQRLQVLLALGDADAVEDQLVTLVDLFPEETEHKETLVLYYISRGELDKTEAFLRRLVAEAPEGELGARIDLIRFLTELRSPEAARQEIELAILETPNPAAFQILRATLDFTSGNTDQAISDLEAALADAEPSDETNAMKVTLARMQLSTGNEVRARSLVESVLAEDEGNVAALKMSAAWAIEADDTDGAIATLRTALDSDPSDTETLTLMAQAYTRAGSNDLARDFLALAVEESGNAPAETVRYAQLLIDQERYLPAEDILLPALRIAPNNLALLQTAGRLYLAMGDMGRAQQVVETLRRIESDEATRMAVALEAERLNQTNGTDEALQYLENLANTANADVSAKILLLRARLSTGDVEGAVELAEDLVAEQPDDPSVRLVQASTVAVAGDLDRALQLYQTLADDFPEAASLQVQIASLQARNGDQEAARQTIAAALENAPDDPRLLWASASYLELDGDIEGAIAVYERMYEQDSSSIVVANNLASLIGTYRDDPDSIEFAWTIARRFRDSDLPAIQDTYGWLTHRRGNSEDALPYLESAASQLTRDPIVQYHLAEILYALDRKEAALDQYRTALDQAGVGDTRPQIERTRAQIAALEAELAATE